MATGINNLPYPGKVYVPFDILTAQELNEDVANIESLATGTGIGDEALNGSVVLQDNSVPTTKLYLNLAGTVLAGSTPTNVTVTTPASVSNTNYPPVTLNVPSGYKVIFWGQGSAFQSASVAADNYLYVNVDNTTNSPEFRNTDNANFTGGSISMAGQFTGLSAGNHTFRLYASTSSGNTMTVRNVFIFFAVIAS